MNDTSLSLLDRIRSSADTKAWYRLHDLYVPLLRHWLRSYNVQDADADDLVQEVLSVVVNELPAFDHNRRVGAFRNWLRKTLVHRLRNFWRSRQSVPLASGSTAVFEKLNQLEDDHSELSQLWNTEHDHHVLSKLIEDVRPRFEERTWEAFRLQVLEGERADRVAEALHMSLSSVYVARSRVLSALRKESAGLAEF